MKKLVLFICVGLLCVLFHNCSTSSIDSEEIFEEMRAENSLSGEMVLRDILQLISNQSDIETSDKLILQRTLQQLDAMYPRLKALLQLYYRNNGAIIFRIDPALPGDGMYSTESKVITFRSAAFITPDRLLEELLHVVQHFVAYGDRMKEDRNYMQKSKRNIEYEVLVFQDIMRYLKARKDAEEGRGDGSVALRGANAATEGEYKAWLFSIIMPNLRQKALESFNGRAYSWGAFGNLPYNEEFNPLLLANYLYVVLY